MLLFVHCFDDYKTVILHDVYQVSCRGFQTSLNWCMCPCLKPFYCASHLCKNNLACFDQVSVLTSSTCFTTRNLLWYPKIQILCYLLLVQVYTPILHICTASLVFCMALFYLFIILSGNQGTYDSFWLFLLCWHSCLPNIWTHWQPAHVM